MSLMFVKGVHGGGHLYLSFAALFLLAAASCSQPQEPPEQDLASADPIGVTTHGHVEGVRESPLSIFLGIPFAAPPVDDLRWRPPEPPENWDGLREAKSFAPSCYQNAQYLEAPEHNTSEDCLYLNIWTPAASADERLPVMAWIYGGGFAAGATSNPVQNGDELAARGVVVVSMGYRVGPFGFLAHPALSAESPQEVSGNYGLLDQIAALKWVQDNIENFGGDPDKVTIFGESAGAISVSMLSTSPLAEGLFRGAISQSGGSFGPTHSPPLPGENVQRLDQAEAIGIEFAEKLNAADIAEMRTVPAADILAASLPSPDAPFPEMRLSWPVLDGYVILGDQYELYEQGEYNDVAALIGFNSDEASMWGGQVTPAEYEKATRDRFGPYAETLLEAYAAEPDDATQASRDLATDVMFGWHTLSWAKLQSRTGTKPIYMYYFAQRPPYPEDHPFANVKGAPHAAEMPYVFDHLEVYPEIPWRPEDAALSDAMADYWTNFVKTLDPNDGELPHWPQFSENEPQVMILENGPHAGALPSYERYDILDDYFAWRRTPEGRQP
ncbi:carboxylesterase/lipase family protein [Hyphococcus luteus]|uniref:Carboxylic ester hydrolase n=1 Tax=Hyphococcus luteus TaxID=2058213 RepID=A0A2S7K556_9PROT|nr:carboxylesterase family protein [Marinicaulis flavus]PQA87644.1 carboxylesterase [Marinicaulis flavus]